jgi:hypothetical protein
MFVIATNGQAMKDLPGKTDVLKLSSWPKKQEPVIVMVRPAKNRPQVESRPGKLVELVENDP